MNRIIPLAVAAAAAKAKRDAYTWTAYKIAEQDKYLHKTVSPYYPESQVADEVYDPCKNDVVQRPVLEFGNAVPKRIDMHSEEFARLDMSEAVAAGFTGARVQGVAAVEDGKELVISVSAKIMILLPMAEDDSEAKHSLIRWQPDVFSHERIEVRLVRDDTGETSLELFFVDSEQVETVDVVPFDQWDLNREKNNFRLTIRNNNVALSVNGQVVYDKPHYPMGKGDGCISLFDRVEREKLPGFYQTMNVAELHRLGVVKR